MNLTLDLFGTIPIKQIDVSVLPRTTVVPLGNSVGLKLYTEGVLVVGMSEINPFASKLLAANFPKIKNWGDITKIEPKELPDFLLQGEPWSKPQTDNKN